MESEVLNYGDEISERKSIHVAEGGGGISGAAAVELANTIYFAKQFMLREWIYQSN